MDVSIIIVNYNTKELLADCIKSIILQTNEIDYEIIVVDNNSHDGSQSQIKTDFPNVKLIESKENLGFGRANNLGSKEAKGKYLFYLNSDTILKNNAVKILFDYAESSDERIGALGCILQGPDGKNCHSFGKFITLKTEIYNLFTKYIRFLKESEYLKPQSIDKAKEVEYITGADLFVPKQVYEITGGFDSDFFMYCEENDWEKRMSLLDLKRLIIPGPSIVHLEGGSDSSKSHTWSPSRLRNLYSSKRTYMRKHNSKFIYFIYRVCCLPLQFPLIVILSVIKDKDYIKLLRHI